jgi:hypothetical protein
MPERGSIEVSSVRGEVASTFDVARHEFTLSLDGPVNNLGHACFQAAPSPTS